MLLELFESWPGRSNITGVGKGGNFSEKASNKAVQLVASKCIPAIGVSTELFDKGIDTV